ncbi:MAG TPA: peroxiredoxin-like family protein [Polyangiaceae bacterium]|nr:peroxiredoxin-like family protein [Polyangiaceae bacterium]
MTRVDFEALGRANVVTAAGQEIALASLFGTGPCLLAFLRHFGCVACSEQITRLSPRLRELAQLGVAVVCVGNGEKRYLDGFIERHALSDKHVHVVSDVERASFRAAGMLRSWWSVFGPRALYGELRGRGAGHQFRGIEGDALQQGGVVLLDADRQVALHYVGRATGDYADPNLVVGAALQLQARAALRKGSPVV